MKKVICTYLDPKDADRFTKGRLYDISEDGYLKDNYSEERLFTWQEMNSLEGYSRFELVEDNEKHSKYKKTIKSELIDVYDILKAYEVSNPALQHAIKKLLVAGGRGYKDTKQDLQEAIDSIERAIELNNG